MNFSGPDPASRRIRRNAPPPLPVRKFQVFRRGNLFEMNQSQSGTSASNSQWMCGYYWICGKPITQIESKTRIARASRIRSYVNQSDADTSNHAIVNVSEIHCCVNNVLPLLKHFWYEQTNMHGQNGGEARLEFASTISKNVFDHFSRTCA